MRPSSAWRRDTGIPTDDDRGAGRSEGGGPARPRPPRPQDRSTAPAGERRDRGPSEPVDRQREAGRSGPRTNRSDGTPGFAHPETETWIDEGEVRDDAADAVARGRRGGGGADRPRRRGRRGGSTPKAIPVPADVEASDEGRAGLGPERSQDLRTALERAVGAPRGRRLERRLREASEDYEEGRYDEASRVARQVATEAPGVAAARELYGLTLYRLGRWKAAVKELEAFRTLTGSTEQHPVLADCYRALKRYADVDELWTELREVSPSAELVTEGRIVAAGALADQGDLAGALRTLSHGWRIPSKPRPHHLRRAYALADLYERAGELPRARELFGWVAGHAPDFGDVTRRVRNLG